MIFRIYIILTIALSYSSILQAVNDENKEIYDNIYSYEEIIDEIIGESNIVYQTIADFVRNNIDNDRAKQELVTRLENLKKGLNNISEKLRRIRQLEHQKYRV